MKKLDIIEFQGGGASENNSPARLNDVLHFQKPKFSFSKPFIPKFLQKIPLTPVSRLTSRFSPARPPALALAEPVAPANIPQNARRAAFTMAEVLITLGVIGIVAAMTLPALITRNQNKALEASLKKNYSVILQAFEMYQAEHGERLRPEMLGGGNSPTGLKAQIMPYFNIIADCGSNSNTHPACIPYNADNPKNPYSTYDGKPKIGLTFFDDGQFVLTDGSLILIENMTGSSNILITVDVNGRNKNPNKWGHDLFTFHLTADGRILPAGSPMTSYSDKNSYCSAKSTQSRNGIGCTYHALNDKDYFNNLPR